MAYIGAESANDKLLHDIRKGTRANQTIEVVEKCRAHGVVPELSFMLAPPEDPEGETEQTFKFIRQIKRIHPATEIMLYIYTPLPPSPHNAGTLHAKVLRNAAQLRDAQREGDRISDDRRRLVAARMGGVLEPHRRAVVDGALAAPHPGLHYRARLPLPDHHRHPLAAPRQTRAARDFLVALSLRALRPPVGAERLQADRQAPRSARDRAVGSTSVKLAREIWSVLDHRQHRVLLGMLLVCILAAFTTVGGIAAVVPFLAFLADPRTLESHTAIHQVQVLFGITRQEDMLLLLGCAFFGAVLLSNCVNLLAMVAAEKFAHSIAGALQLRLFDTYLRLDCGFHAAADHASLATNILLEVHRLTNGIIYSGLMLVTQAISSVLIVCFVVAVNPVAALAAVITFGTAYLFIYLVVRRHLASHGRVFTREWHERARLVNEGLGAVKEIFLMRNQAFFTRRFADQTRKIAQSQAGIAAISQSPRYILECVMVACLVGVALWLGRTPGSGNWLVQLSFLGMAAYRLLPALQQSFANAAKISSNRAAFEKIAHDLRRNRHGVDHGNAPPDPAWRERPRRAIKVRDVTFRYAADRQAALHRLSLDIEAGSFVALVGPNGSGKTTLADVILGLLRPAEGSVEIDGITLDDTNLASWQSAAAYVPQTIFLLNMSLAENIALGTARADIDETRLREAIVLANLQEFVASLPRGVDEPLGERGVNLSGGQRQRVGIARALYRRPSLLVLDEATAALDTEAESTLVDVLAELRGRCTIVLIAHRFSSLRRCDRVFELERGAIVRSGSIAPGEGMRRDRAAV